ncbi:MAG: hypothetical protein GVY18_09060 [Bacteroidetes bacterium]|jgi:hypothetical protein|nr:hypothetical protein [Bacteroidota bacterium]
MTKTKPKRDKPQPDEVVEIGAETHEKSTSHVPPRPRTEKRKPQSSVETKSVDNWARELGHRRWIRNPHPGRYEYDSEHACAAVVHGWDKHAHHAGRPMRISKADYLAAIEAAKRPPPGTRRYQPHPAALSPHKER